MATLTLSTDGEHLSRPVHDVEKVEAASYYGGDVVRHTAVITMSIEQALGIAYDLLYQAVDAGAIANWSVNFPDRTDG